MIRITRLTNRYGKCGASIEFEESKDAALYLLGKIICEFLITKDGHKFETSSTNVEDIERELNNFADGWDMTPRNGTSSYVPSFEFTVTDGENSKIPSIENNKKVEIGTLRVGKYGFGIDFDFENDLRKNMHGNYKLYADMKAEPQEDAGNKS